LLSGVVSHHLHAELAFMPGKPQPRLVDAYTYCAYKLLHRLVTQAQIGVESTTWVAVMMRQVPGGVELAHTLYKDVLEDMADAGTSSKLRRG